jgi:UPF0755 protein
MAFFKKRWIIIFAIGVLIVLSGAVAGYGIYQRIYRSNLTTDTDRPFLYIPTGASFARVCALLSEHGLQDTVSFRWVAGRMNYSGTIKSGRYRLTNGMSNIELVRLLRSGRQVPVKVTFNNIRTATQLAGAVAPDIEADSADIVRSLADSAFLRKYELTPATALCLFIPNTYEFRWNTSADRFMERMGKEYARFWNDARKKKAEETGLTPLQVSTLASIIEEETQKDGEKPTMAGVYLNRLNRGIPLQADPTIKFAAGDFTIRRILNKHKEIDSPYNTYLYPGLPPGPICVPSIASLDAVLNYQKNDYLYFCAKEDMSGYHNFARTLTQHNRNAQVYQQALDKLHIYK